MREEVSTGRSLVRRGLLVRGLALAPVAAMLIALSACSGGLTTSATDACNYHFSWVSEGSAGLQEGRREQLLRTMSESLSAEDPKELTEAVTVMETALEGGDDEAFQTASAAFASSCRANGWELPEG
ncbi:hypothetical protein [Rathayibacter sp. AY1A7]|uniref:hypothetical protein n=1 Tax=Rathayibacter sp. AY1A7 TaxID=2080524 RepID=UPI0011B060DB|nr:hypothetical protein [Rathayibacter sp. AY1A7]